jgi:diguanylate cyclase (GGDEF)-like protein
LNPEALIGSQAISIAAAFATSKNHPKGIDFLNAIIEFLPESLVKTGLILATKIPPDDMEQAIQTYGSKYYSLSKVNTAVPFSLWCAAYHLDNYQEALWWTVSGLGRRESNCAIVGSIVALSSGFVPHAWIGDRETLPREVDVVLKENENFENHKNGLLEHVFQPVGSNKGGPIPSLTIRQNSLTGLPNLIEFLEMLDNSFRQQKIPHNYVTIHISSLSQIEKKQGHTGKENVLKILSGNLRRFSTGKVYQISDELFIIVLVGIVDFQKNMREISNCVSKAGIENGTIKFIQFPDTQSISSSQILSCLQTGLSESNGSSGNDTQVIIKIEELENMERQNIIFSDLTRQLQKTTQQYDEIEKIAFTDSVSQLPNMRAARIKLESQIQIAKETNVDFAIFLFDGDNLRRYNAISFEDGDEAIRLLGKTLSDNIRESDYVARWRTGDEFLVILPKTSINEAIIIGNNLCLSVQNASKEWKFPSTISGGGVLFPSDGEVIYDLLELVEKRMKNAKRRGKNRIVFGRKK